MPRNLGVHKPASRVRKDLRLPQPLLMFKIWPEKRQQFYMVQIYRTDRQLEEMHRAVYPRHRNHEVWGFLKEHHDRQRIGTIYLSLRSCTDNTVSHEIFHGALRWADHWMRFDPCDVVGWRQRIHERVAEAHGNMVSDFWRQFTAAGFPRRECWGFERK